MGFWTKSNGEQAGANADVNQDGVETGKVIRIPDRTKVLGVLKSIELLPVREGKEADAQDGATLGYKVEWEVIEKGEYQGSIQRQGIKIFASKDRTRDEALELLFFMDNLFADGRFQASGEEPDIAEMEAAFQNKPAILLIRGMESENAETGEKSYFNWVGGVFRYKEPAVAHKTPADAVNAAKAKISAGAATVAAAANKPKQETAAERKARLLKEMEEAEQAAQAEAAQSEDGVAPGGTEVDPEDLPY